jgi:hypothetical protein
MRIGIIIKKRKWNLNLFENRKEKEKRRIIDIQRRTPQPPLKLLSTFYVLGKS